MVKEQLVVWPPASMAVQVTVVAPTGNIEPDTGAQLTTGFGSTASFAVTV